MKEPNPNFEGIGVKREENKDIQNTHHTGVWHATHAVWDLKEEIGKISIASPHLPYAVWEPHVVYKLHTPCGSLRRKILELS
ncbi:hypothetical protein LINGRAHAP2_LOCUS11385 [Linum grandiflorum]